MATIDDLGPTIANGIRALFTQANFCFATVTPNRSPTFYFAVGGVNNLTTAQYCGRIRTNHSSGPLIDISTHSKGHVFLPAKADHTAVRKAIKAMGQPTAPESGKRLTMDFIEQQYPTTPQAGYYHYEYTKGLTTVDAELLGTLSRTHPSGGTVALQPRPTQVQIDRMLGLMLANQCTVKLNGSVVKKIMGPAPRPIPGVAAYLNYLDSLG
jgi:hypothetical protein